MDESNKIYIGRNALHAVSLFAAREDIRYFLCGVLVEATANSTRLVATDGHTLAMHQALHSGNSPGRVIIPIEIVEYMLTWTKQDLPFALTLGDECRVEQAGKAVFKGIDGQYPDYRKAIPDALSGEIAQFNPMYIARCAKASAALRRVLDEDDDDDGWDAKELREFPGISPLGNGVPKIGHNGNEGAAVVSYGDANFLMIVKPMMAERMPAIADFAWAKADQP